MRVLVCIPCLLTGGTEIQTLSLVEALIGAGHSVTVACYFEYAAAMVERYRRAQVELLSVGAWVDTTKIPRPVGSLRTLWFLCRKLRPVVGRVSPDVAHVQYMAPGALPILALKMLGVGKIVATAHTAADIYPSLGQLKWLCGHVLSAFQCITLAAERSFFGSARLYSSATPLLPGTERPVHFTIHNALPSYIPLAETSRRHAPATVGVVSRLEPIKGMDLVVPAFAKIHGQCPGARLVVAGDGSLRSLMERQAVEAGLPKGSVEFLGRQGQERLAEVYDRIDVLLMPSRSEGFGLTALEGMARGCVAVAARVGGLPEVVSDGVCGLLCQPESAESLAENALLLLDSPDRFRRYSSAALARAAGFDFKNYSSQIADLYSRL